LLYKQWCDNLTGILCFTPVVYTGVYNILHLLYKQWCDNLTGILCFTPVVYTGNIIYIAFCFSLSLIKKKKILLTLLKCPTNLWLHLCSYLSPSTFVPTYHPPPLFLLITLHLCSYLSPSSTFVPTYHPPPLFLLITLHLFFYLSPSTFSLALTLPLLSHP
jgi:hypothetical protein